jgi:hypothetical protein
MFPYVRPEVAILNISHCNPKLIEQATIMASHNILAYTTNLPKRLVMWNNSHNNPYHYFFYMLGKFYKVDNGIDQIIYYYPKSTSYLAEEGMRLLPKRFERRTEKEEGYEYVHIPGLSFHRDFIGETIVYSYVRNLFKDIYINTKQEPGKYIYIARSNCNSRNVLNEKELIPMLKDIGISVYYLEKMTFIDSIRLFKSAQFVTGLHGAGLSWCMFCDPKTLVLEIYKNKPFKNHFYHLCKELDLEYWKFFYVIADEKTEQKDPTLSDDGDIIVPVDLYKNSILKLLKDSILKIN